MKSENILLGVDENGQFHAKIIDFGSGYIQGDKGELSTPEYLPPEVLENGEMTSSHVWSVDIWSLGIVILELVIGFPVWMSYKGRIVKQN